MPYGRDNTLGQYAPQPSGNLGAGGVADIIARLQAALGQSQSSAAPSGPIAGGIFQPGPSMGLSSELDFNKYGGIGNQPYGPPYSGQGQEATDPFNDALAQLDALINQMSGGVAASSHGVMNGIRKAYGAQIAGIKDLNQDAREDTKVGSKEVRKMYRALQKSYMNAGKREMKQGKSTAAQLQALGAGSAGEATDAAAAINAQNVAAAQALGAPDIAAQLNAEVNAQQQGTANQAIAQAGRSARTALGTSDNERKYYNTQGTTSRLEGTNRAADMYDKLQDYLEGNQNKIAEIGGQRSAALSSAASQMQGAQSDVLADIIAKKMALLGMSEEHRQSLMDANQPQENPLDKLFPALGVQNQLLAQTPAPLAEAFRQLADDEAMSSGQWTDPSGKVQNLQNNLPALLDFIKDNKEADAYEEDPQMLSLLQMLLNLQLQGHPGAAPQPNPADMLIPK